MLASSRRLPHFEWFVLLVVAGTACLLWSFFAEEPRHRRRMRVAGILLLAAALPVQNLAIFLAERTSH